ncbi:MAG: hypothetical protein IMX05_01480 [Hydrogenibacillus schlegelii]|nr:hypothetical protein [Hydrogenibacillus schlegelii]
MTGRPPSVVETWPVGDLRRIARIPSPDARIAWVLANIAAILGAKDVKISDFLPPWARDVGNSKNEGLDPATAVKLWVEATKNAAIKSPF